MRTKAVLMKKFLNRKVSVKSLLIIFAAGITVMAALAAAPTRIQVTLSPDITILYNGVRQTPRDINGDVVYPIINNGSTYLPVRAVSNMLGIDVGWDQATKTISLWDDAASAPQTGTIPGAGGSVSVNGTTLYAFSPDRSGVWQFRTSNCGISDPYLWIYDSHGDILAQDDDGAGLPNALISIYLTEGTEYTIRAGFRENGAGSYTLTATREPSLSPAGDTRVDSATTYAFTPDRTGLWTFRTTNNGNSDPYLLISEQNGYNIGGNDDGGDGYNALMTVPLTAGEIYNLEVGFFSNYTGCTLSVSMVPQIDIPTAGGSISVNGPTAFLFTPDQSGIWVFLTAENGGGDPFLTVYDADGVFMMRDDDSGGNSNARITINLRAGMTYLILASFYGGDTHGNYILNIGM